jgi:hypothetical protein
MKSKITRFEIALGLIMLLVAFTGDVINLHVSFSPARFTREEIQTVDNQLCSNGVTLSEFVLQGRVVTMESEQAIIENGAILVRNGIIESIWDFTEGPPAGLDLTGIEIIHTGGLIFPGLIDCHNHIDGWNTLPIWDVPDIYTNRYQWRDKTITPEYNTNLRFPRLMLTHINNLDLLVETVKYAEVKALVGGTVAIQGSRWPPKESLDSILVRNLEQENFGKRKVEYNITAVGDLKEGWVDKVLNLYNTGELDALFIHLGEGTDAQSRQEFEVLKEIYEGKTLLIEPLVAIHCTGLNRTQFSEMASVGAKMVWSPTSNLLLYGNTSDVKAAWEEGVCVALSPDWSPSGTKNVLGELKIADAWNSYILNGFFSEYNLTQMVTVNAAIVAGWEDFVGRIRVGLHADLLVIDDPGGNPYRALIDTIDEDVLLTVIEGEPLYGLLDWMERLKAGDYEVINGGNFVRGLDITKEAIPQGDQTWETIVSTLEEAIEFDPVFLHSQIDPEATEEEFLQWLETKYPGLHAVPLDPIFTQNDPAFFNAIETSANFELILGNLLDLREEYYSVDGNRDTIITSQITDNSNDDFGSDIYNGQVTWSMDDGNDHEILFYDYSTQTTVQLTENEYDDDYSQIHDGLVTWMGFDGADYEIFLYNSTDGITTQITDNNNEDKFPEIHNGQITWRRNDGQDLEIFLFDSNTGDTTQITDNSRRDYYCVIHNGQIAWRNWDGTDYEISFYDPHTGSITQITDNDKNDDPPQIHNGKVAWRGRDENDFEIFIYDSDTGITTQITNNLYDDNSPIIHNNKIVWFADAGADTEIFLYDSDTGFTTQITDNFYDDNYPVIQDGQIVWRGFDGSDFEIFIHDLNSEFTIQLTDNEFNDNYHKVHFGQVSWQGVSSGADQEIFLSNSLQFLFDTDNDGLTDADEMNIYGTSVLSDDSDDDGIGDLDEIFLYNTNPLENTESYTSPGQNSEVVDQNYGISLTFDEVTSAGATTIAESETGYEPPLGFQLGDVYYSISTTADYTGSIHLMIPYNESAIENENNLGLMHFNEETGIWENVTTSIDTVNNIIYGVVSDLSPFAIMELIPTSLNVEVLFHGWETEIKSTLILGGSPLADFTIKIFINGEFLEEALTNKEGCVSIQWAPDYSGTYIIEAVFEDDILLGSTDSYIIEAELEWYEYSWNKKKSIKIIEFYENDDYQEYLGEEEYHDGIKVYDTYVRGDWDVNFKKLVNSTDRKNYYTEQGWYYLYSNLE